ncbi:epoxide hydrolase family protein [Nannocystis radixulma]|uniref:Epoxide hydrolase n=1 Tax=Nannocystis radixulma TaxID=2995305 RepID=A0ABT5AZT6_9BACT|nr:epoxide hydrolase family protein [Nannocystis radixulma]MDC0666955.1 epoxide hydrolase [Nannocystis radixulma]
MQSTTSFTVTIPETQLVDLRERLAMTRFPSELPDVGWERGAPLAVIRELCDHWQHRFDWRKVEAELNRHPQFIGEIDGQSIHFIHARSRHPNARPLLLIHGWPGSVLEYTHLIDALTDPVAHGGRVEDAFHVVLPSVPGFGFSGPTREKGWSPERVARAFVDLMVSLGYERFGVHGNDFGSIAAREIALAAPERLIGAHVTQFFAFPSGDPAEFAALGPADHARLAELELFGQRDGYNQIMGKRPQALAYALNDSPVGLLAWNLDLLTSFGDRPHQLTPEQILAGVTLYWLTGTSGSAAAIYFEAGRAGTWEKPDRTTAPMGISVFRHDFRSIRTFAERYHERIVFWAEHDEGGHFASLEVPARLLADVRAFFAPLR